MAGSGTETVVTKRCRLSLLTNSALIYEYKCGGGRVSANEFSCAQGAQINFVDLTNSYGPSKGKLYFSRKGRNDY
jgi:hypothetical protein